MMKFCSVITEVSLCSFLNRHQFLVICISSLVTFGPKIFIRDVCLHCLDNINTF